MYTLVLIPEVKIAEKKSVILSYFQRKSGPVIWYSHPDDLSEREKPNITEVLAQASKQGFYTHQTSTLSSLNHYFEIYSDWARGNKEMLMISIILDNVINQAITNIIKSILNDKIENLKKIKHLYKALYINDIDSYPKEEQSDIIEISDNLRANIKEIYKKVKLSIDKTQK